MRSKFCSATKKGRQKVPRSLLKAKLTTENKRYVECFALKLAIVLAIHLHSSQLHIKKPAIKMAIIGYQVGYHFVLNSSVKMSD